MTRHLLKGGRIGYTTQTKNILIFDIDSKLLILKSYKMQLQTLGYIVTGSGSSSIMRDNTPITRMINGQINRHCEMFDTNYKYSNAVNLLKRYIINPVLLERDNHMFDKFQAAALGVELKDLHTSILRRMFKRGHALALRDRVLELIKN